MIYKRLGDAELVKKYSGGNELALKELLRRYKSKIFTTIYLIVKDRYIAEDIFQETFYKAILQIREGKYSNEGKFLPWISRIGYNKAIDHFRKSKKFIKATPYNGEDIFDQVEAYEEPVESRLMKEEQFSIVARLLSELPENQREIIIMRHYSDMSFKEIAAATNVSINTALGRMRYALQNLRKLIFEHNIVI